MVELVRGHFKLTPKGIIETLNLRRPIYRKTAAFGHFGRTEPEFTWEKTDKAAALKSGRPAPVFFESAAAGQDHPPPPFFPRLFKHCSLSRRLEAARHGLRLVVRIALPPAKPRPALLPGPPAANPSVLGGLPTSTRCDRTANARKRPTTPAPPGDAGLAFILLTDHGDGTRGRLHASVPRSGVLLH